MPVAAASTTHIGKRRPDLDARAANPAIGPFEASFESHDARFQPGTQSAETFARRPDGLPCPHRCVSAPT